MLNKKKRNNKGFTLVELLVVIAIIGILAVVAVPSLMKNIDKARVAEATSYINAYKTAAISEYTNASVDTSTGVITVDNSVVAAAVEGKKPNTITEIVANVTDSDITVTVTVGDAKVKEKLAAQFQGDSSIVINE